MIRAAIAGGTGYTGGELFRILLGHPDVQIVAATTLYGRRTVQDPARTSRCADSGGDHDIFGWSARDICPQGSCRRDGLMLRDRAEQS